MSDALRAWLTEELERRKWSQRELARQADISRAFVNRVLSGDISPSVNFCYKIAQALGEAPEKILRLAGIVPASPSPEDDPTLTEIQDIVNNLSFKQRKLALRLLRSLYQSGEDEE